MDKQWKQYVPFACAGAGAAMLAAAAAVCMGLDQGGRLDRAGIAVVLALLADE